MRSGKTKALFICIVKLNKIKKRTVVFYSNILYFAFLRKNDVKSMATYISGVRQELYDALKVEGSLHDWEHIIKQIGMFCYSGLDSEQVNLTSS